MILTTEGLGHPPFRDCRTTGGPVSGVTTVVDQGLMCDTLFRNGRYGESRSDFSVIELRPIRSEREYRI